MRGSEEDAHRRAFRDADDGGALGSDGVHDRADVVHPNLERRVGGHGVGHACPALVENDQSGKRGDALEEGAQERNGPRKLDVRGRAGNEDDVERPVAGDTVGDVDVAAARVADFGDHGRIIRE